MPAVIDYFLKLSLCLTVVFLFYQFILRRLTFYSINRWFFLIYGTVSFFIPFININPLLQKNELDSSKVISYIPTVQSYSASMEEATICPEPMGFATWTKWDWIQLGFMIGATLLLIRFLIRYISFRRLVSKARLVSTGSMNLYQVDKDIIPFSFGNGIYLNRSLHSESEFAEIIRHEFVHVRQKHSIDIIWAELLCILNWYNPFAWLIRRAVRQNLEFIADDIVVAAGIDKKQYQYLLLKVIGNSHFSIANQFNFSSLKKRIAMMNKMKTNRLHLLRLLLVLPAILIVLVAFRKPVSISKLSMSNIAEQTNNPLSLRTTGSTDTIPSDTEWNPITSEAEKSFISRHPRIEGIRWSFVSSMTHSGPASNDRKVFAKEGDMFMTIHFKNGKFDSYNLGKHADIDRFKKNYGELPPSPPAPPIAISLVSAKVSSSIAGSKLNSQFQKNSRGFYISIVDDKGNCTVIVKDANQIEVEKLSLTDWNLDRQRYEAKYGEIPPVKHLESSHPSKDPNPKISSLWFTADNILWTSKSGLLHLMGNASLHDSLQNISFTSDSIELFQDITSLYINGKPAAPNTAYSLNTGDKYQLKRLNSTEALLKYGEDAKNGAVELTLY